MLFGQIVVWSNWYSVKLLFSEIDILSICYLIIVIWSLLFDQIVTALNCYLIKLLCIQIVDWPNCYSVNSNLAKMKHPVLNTSWSFAAKSTISGKRWLVSYSCNFVLHLINVATLLWHLFTSSILSSKDQGFLANRFWPIDSGQ